MQKLQQIYSGTRAWGTVRVQVKRVFEERRQWKRSQKQARQQDRVEDCKDSTREFSLAVKAATPKRKVSTVVSPSQAGSFEQKLSQVMTQAIFRQVLERQEREKKDKKKKVAKKEEVKAAKGSKREAPGKIKKNRRERRKDLAKQKKKLNLAKLRAERRGTTAPSAPAPLAT